MKSYLILDFSIADLAGFMPYVTQIPALIKNHQGKYLIEGRRPERVEGEWQPERLVVLEFDTRQNVTDFLADPEVAALFRIRHKSTTGHMIWVDGGSWRDEIAAQPHD